MRCINSDSSDCVRLGVLAASDDNSSGDARAGPGELAVELTVLVLGLPHADGSSAVAVSCDGKNGPADDQVTITFGTGEVTGTCWQDSIRPAQIC